jgi:hypothetical protein
MAAFCGPPGHSAQPAALIAAKLAGLSLAVEAPDADLKVSSQKHAIGDPNIRSDANSALISPPHPSFLDRRSQS